MDAKARKFENCACGNPSNHWSSKVGYQCCACYVKAGNPPADWHHACMTTFAALQQSSEGGEVMRYEYTLTNDELVAAIAAAWERTQKTTGISQAYPKTLEHYHRLLEIQQQRAAQCVAKADEIPEPTIRHCQEPQAYYDSVACRSPNCNCPTSPASVPPRP